MALTKGQISMHWREWKKVADVYKKAGFSTEEIEEERHEMYRQATGGKCESIKDLTWSTFNDVLAAFWKISKPNETAAQIRQKNLTINQRIKSIENMGYPEEYIEKICLNAFKVSMWKNLRDDQLKNLHITLKNRSRAQFKKK